MLTGSQIAEARALLGLSRGDLAAEVGILDIPTLKRIESFDEIPLTAQRYVAAVRAALDRGIAALGDPLKVFPGMHVDKVR